MGTPVVYGSLDWTASVSIRDSVDIFPLRYQWNQKTMVKDFACLLRS